jgi:hypothetical protein
MEFDDGPHLFFDAGPNHPGDSFGGLFGVIHVAGDQDGQGGDRVREAAAPAQPVPQTLTLSNALPIGDLQGSGAVLGGVPAQPAMPTGPAPAAATPSASPAGSSQAVPLASTPPGPAIGVPDYRVRDQAFADLEGNQSVALAPTADPPWTW